MSAPDPDMRRRNYIASIMMQCAMDPTRVDALVTEVSEQLHGTYRRKLSNDDVCKAMVDLARGGVSNPARAVNILVDGYLADLDAQISEASIAHDAIRDAIQALEHGVPVPEYTDYVQLGNHLASAGRIFSHEIDNWIHEIVRPDPAETVRLVGLLYQLMDTHPVLDRYRATIYEYVTRRVTELCAKMKRLHLHIAVKLERRGELASYRK